MKPKQPQGFANKSKKKKKAMETAIAHRTEKNRSIPGGKETVGGNGFRKRREVMGRLRKIHRG